MTKYYRVKTDYGFAGTDDEIIIEASDDISPDDVFQEYWEEMIAQLSCDVDEIDREEFEKLEDYGHNTGTM